MLNLYTVWGPEYRYEEPVSYMIGGPRYETQDFINVMARNKRRAKVVAVKIWRKHGEKLEDGDMYGRKYVVSPGYWWGDTNWKNPFGMLTVDKVGPVERWRETTRTDLPDEIDTSELNCYYE